MSRAHIFESTKEAVTDLWRLVLVRHRRTWDAERDALFAK